MKYKELIRKINLHEGVYDTGIFKAFFLAGGPGSGKTFVTAQAFAGTGLRVINSDRAFENAMRKAGLSLKMPDDEQEVRDMVRARAKATTQKMLDLSLDGRLFVTCSSGIWMNPFTGEQSIIQGQLQLWNSDTMVLIDSIDLGEHSAPWHIKESPIDDVVYVALAGDNLYDTEGVACVRFENDILTLDWLNTHSSFDTFHGIDVSDDG